MIRRTAIVYTALVVAASLFLGTHLAHAQELAATSHAVVQSSSHTLLSSEAVALSTELGELKARRAAIDFTGAHWLLGLGVVASITTGVFAVAGLMVAAVEGAFNAFTGSSSHGANVPMDIAGGTAVGAIALYLASAAWCVALNVQRSSIDSRIRDIGTSFGLAPTPGGFGASATIKL